MKTLITFLSLISLNLHAYYIDRGGSLFYENGRYTGLSGVSAISLDFSQNSYGFVLRGDSLYLATENQFGLEIIGFLQAGVSEIEYPYYIKHQNLYLYNARTTRSRYILPKVANLCMRTVIEYPITEFSNAYAIDGIQKKMIFPEQRPRYCQ